MSRNVVFFILVVMLVAMGMVVVGQMAKRQTDSFATVAEETAPVPTPEPESVSEEQAEEQGDRWATADGAAGNDTAEPGRDEFAMAGGATDPLPASGLPQPEPVSEGGDTAKQAMQDKTEGEATPAAQPQKAQPQATVAKKAPKPEKPATAKQPKPAEVADATKPKPKPKPKSTRNSIRAVRMEDDAGHILVVFTTAEPVAEFNAFTLDKPRRLVVDMKGTWQDPPKPGVEANDKVLGVRMGHHPDKLRVVVDLANTGVRRAQVRRGGPSEVVVDVE